MIKSISYPVNNQLINQGLLASYISKFWNEIFSPLIIDGADKHLMLLVKASFTEASIDCSLRTMGHLRSVNYSDKELFTEYLSERLSYLDESYTTNPINKLLFSYIERDGLATDDERKLLQEVSEEDNLSFHRFNNLILPISMKVEDYGTVLATTVFETFTRYIVNNGKRNYKIDVSLDGLTNNVTILGPVGLNWVDSYLTMDGVFRREIGKSTKYFLDGVNILNKQIIPAKAFRKTKIDTKKVSNFVTMDIETINKEGKLIPYLVCGYNGTDYITSYASSTLDQKDLFSNFITQLLSKDFGGKAKLNVYAHNLSGFDGIFLLKQLLPHGEVKPLKA